jgi:hypothetical protein
MLPIATVIDRQTLSLPKTRLSFVGFSVGARLRKAVQAILRFHILL